MYAKIKQMIEQQGFTLKTGTAKTDTISYRGVEFAYVRYNADNTMDLVIFHPYSAEFGQVLDNVEIETIIQGLKEVTTRHFKDTHEPVTVRDETRLDEVINVRGNGGTVSNGGAIQGDIERLNQSTVSTSSNTPNTDQSERTATTIIFDYSEIEHQIAAFLEGAGNCKDVEDLINLSQWTSEYFLEYGLADALEELYVDSIRRAFPSVEEGQTIEYPSIAEYVHKRLANLRKGIVYVGDNCGAMTKEDVVQEIEQWMRDVDYFQHSTPNNRYQAKEKLYAFLINTLEWQTPYTLLSELTPDEIEQIID